MKAGANARRMPSQRKPQSRQNKVRPSAPRCSPRGYHRIYINVVVDPEVELDFCRATSQPAYYRGTCKTSSETSL